MYLLQLKCRFPKFDTPIMIFLNAPKRCNILLIIQEVLKFIKQNHSAKILSPVSFYDVYKSRRENFKTQPPERKNREENPDRFIIRMTSHTIHSVGKICC